MAFQETKIMHSGDYTIYTVIILVLSFVYYYYKYRNTRATIQSNNLFNNNVNNQSNINQAYQEELRQSEQNLGNTNQQINETLTPEANNTNQIKIFTIINNLRKKHSVDVNITGDEFIRVHLIDIPIPNNKRLMLICKGKRLELNKKLIEGQVTNETVIHGFMVDNINSDSNGNQGNYSNNVNNNTGDYSQNRAAQSNVGSSINSVSIYTIIIHFIIFLFISGFLYFSKRFPDLFPSSNNMLFGILSIFWLTQVSNTLAKLYIYRIIIYE